MITMNDKYGDGSDHECCPRCGRCLTCGDCICQGAGANTDPQEPTIAAMNKPDNESTI